MRLPFAILGAFAVLGAANAQIQTTPSGYVFRVRLQPNQVLNYVNTAQLGKGGARVTSPLIIRVLSVQKNGLARIKMTSGPTMMDKSTVQPKTTIEGSVDRRMRTVGGGDIGAFDGLYPEKPIRLKQSWTAPLNLPGAGVVQTRYTLSRLTRVNGRQVAVLEMRLSGTLKGTGQTLVRVADGTVERSTFNVVARDATGARGELTFSVTRR